MSEENTHFRLPQYDSFIAAIEVLALEISGSELHGMMCGYLCAGADGQGEAYLHALLNNKRMRPVVMLSGHVFCLSVSQQQINNFDFEFEMLLPDEDESLVERAQAFSEWCEGFTQGLDLAGVGADQFYEEEAQEALQHMIEFAELDCTALEVGEEDEKALMEVSEYARLAVIRLHGDLVMNERERSGSDTTH